MKKVMMWSTVAAGILAVIPFAQMMAAGTGATGQTGSSTIQQEKTEHPRIAIALAELHETVADLRRAPHDFGGHRVEAIKACHAAIKQLRLSLEYRENKTGAAANNAPGAAGNLPQPSGNGGLTNSPAYQQEKAAHPQIEWAINKINEAIADLQAAPHDFGGHRADAVADCQAAVKQLQLALEFREQKDAAHAAPKK
jgi:hypothetical protein